MDNDQTTFLGAVGAPTDKYLSDTYTPKEQELIRQLVQERLGKKNELGFESLEDYVVPPKVFFSMIKKPAVSIRHNRMEFSMSSIRLFEGVQHMLNALYFAEMEEDEFEADYIRRKAMSLWYRNGGDVTHDYLKHIRKSVRQEIFEFLKERPINLEVTVNGQKYLLTHAAPMDDYDNSSYEYDDEKEYALWYRYHRYDTGRSDRVVIFGHTGTFYYQANNPTRIWHGMNLIGIDCGATYKPQDFRDPSMRTCLACLRLDDMKEFYSEEDQAEVENEQRV